jgi:hypothetical protein
MRLRGRAHRCAEGEVMRAGIAIDDWKLAIFERHLSQAGYDYENGDALQLLADA